MRPKKPRIVEGVQLVDNLYTDNKGRTDHFRYRRPDGSFRTFYAKSVTDANTLATAANAERHTFIDAREGLRRDQLAFHIPEYVAYMERINPDLARRSEWKNNQYAFTQFATRFDRLIHINRPAIQIWWDELTYYQQKQRQAPFRRFFNWLMGQNLLNNIKFNPFTKADDKPRLLLKLKPEKARPPLTEAGFLLISKKGMELGYQVLPLAMSIGLYTALRESDLCRLTWNDNIADGELRVVVSKSEAQLGSARAARLAWKLSEHPHLKKLIDQARELSLLNRRCPFVLSHRPTRRVWNQDKVHMSQLMPDRLSRMFAEARDEAKLTGVSFHEIRGLSATLYRKAGYTNLQIQMLMAHENVSTTQGYQDASTLPFEPVTIGLDF